MRITLLTTEIEDLLASFFQETKCGQRDHLLDLMWPGDGCENGPMTFELPEDLREGCRRAVAAARQAVEELAAALEGV